MENEHTGSLSDSDHAGWHEGNKKDMSAGQTQTNPGFGSCAPSSSRAFYVFDRSGADVGCGSQAAD